MLTQDSFSDHLPASTGLNIALVNPIQSVEAGAGGRTPSWGHSPQTPNRNGLGDRHSEPLWVQFGCGLCTPPGWLHFDSSLAMRLQKLPLIGAFMPVGEFGRFPANAHYGDIIRGLPIPDNSVDLLYCSHVLEHLTLEEFRLALRNCYRHLRPGGIFRLVVPDLEIMAQEYVKSTSPDAAIAFMQLTWLGRETQSRSLMGFLKDWLSRGQHLWMWDYKSLARELEAVGFCNLRRARFGDSGIAAFEAVEDPERWTYELGIQCDKPT
jgi:SAM-dependent methyltransferase